MKNATLFQVKRDGNFNNNFGRNMMGWMYGYVPVTEMEAVHTYMFEEAWDDIDICQHVFGLAQDSGAFNYSMSTGDVVNVGGEWYRCTGDGWECITGEPGAIGMYIVELPGEDKLEQALESVTEESEEETMETTTNATINNTTSTQEEETMRTGTIEVDFNAANNTPNGDAEGAINAGKEQIGKVWHWFRFKGAGINRSGKQWKADQQQNINNFTGGLGVVLGALDLAGLKPIRKAIMRLFVQAQNGEISVGELKDEIMNMILDRIEFLDGLTDDASLKQCATLKAFTAKNGKKYGEKSIIELIISCILWIIKRTFAKLKEFFGIPEDKMPAIVKFAWGLIKAVFDIILSAGKIVFSIALPGISYVLAGVFKALAWILGWAKSLWDKAKNWFTNLFKKEAPSDETVSEATVDEYIADDFDEFFDDFDGDIDDIAAALAD